MLLHRSKLPIIALVLSIACTNQPLSIMKANIGSNVALNGTITNASLHYTFTPCTWCSTAKDIWNYIYFQGDTLCFAVECTTNINDAIVTAYFENPSTKKTYKAERLEKINTTIYGFSLIGSLLEHIYDDTRMKVPCNTWIALPFVIHITIELQNQKATHSIANTAYISFSK